jgi:tRNA-dependent cyclodipeptide synthase
LIFAMKNFDPTIYYVIGMSPGNSYFKDEEVEFLLKMAIEKFSRVGIFVPDVPAISTYVALGYPENRARRDKAIPQGNALKNRVRKAMVKLGYTDDMVRIFDWEEEVENNEIYRKKFDKIQSLYSDNEKFRDSANRTTRKVLESSKKEIQDMEKATSVASHYLLSEFAFMEFLPAYLGVDRVVYIYHKNWEVFEDYISGSFDGKPKLSLDFLLLENPYETYIPVGGYDNQNADTEFLDVLDRIEKTKTLRVGFANYEPALMYDRDYNNFSGIFYEIIISLARKHGWRVEWTEEVGYGVVVDGLNNNRFDIFGSTAWPTPERKQNADFSIPLYKSPTYIWVRSDDQTNADKIMSDIHARVAVKDNDITDSIASADFPDKRQVRVPQLFSTTEVLRFVSDNKADFTFAEQYLVDIYNQGASTKLVKASDHPIRIYDNSFIIKKGESRFKELLDRELSLMKREGKIKELLVKYTGLNSAFILD